MERTEWMGEGENRMTMGFWICPKCGHEASCHISEFIEECPECDAEFELIENLHGAHLLHTVPIWKIKGESTEYSNPFMAFAGGPNEEALRRYFTALSNIPGSDQKEDGD